MIANAQTHARPRVATAPTLSIEADRAEVKKGESLTVIVDLAGVEAVDLVVVPEGVFRLDLATLTRPGVVRLRGLADGKASLFARARGSDLERVMHLDCVGPTVRVSSFRYVPPQA